MAAATDSSVPSRATEKLRRTTDSVAIGPLFSYNLRSILSTCADAFSLPLLTVGFRKSDSFKSSVSKQPKKKLQYRNLRTTGLIKC